MSPTPAESATLSEGPRDEKGYVYQEQDPVIDELLAAETDDLVGHLLNNIGKLTLKQRVHILLKLSDADFDEFTRRRSEGFMSLTEDVISGKLPTESPEERGHIRAEAWKAEGSLK